MTGAIAAGKSHLCRFVVERYGAVHADADAIVHRMYEADTPAFARIVEEFGADVVGGDGAIDRARLGAVVFGRPERMRALTTAIGDIDAEVRAVIEGWRGDLPHDAIALLEAVNLIEAGYAAWCDATWLVAADASLMLPRLMARNALTEEQALQRLASARAWEDRAAACDRLFLNNASPAEFEAEIDAAVRETLTQHLEGTLPPPAWHRWREETEPQRAAAEGTAQPE